MTASGEERVATVKVKTVEPAVKRRYAAKSVVTVQRHADGSVTRIVLSEGGGRGGVSRRLRRSDRRIRKLVVAHNVVSSEYLRRHRRSNRRKKNGALHELPRNVRRSVRRGMKNL